MVFEMFQEDRNRRDKIKVILTNIFMAISVVAILAITLMLTLGYTITKDLDLTQTGLVRIGSNPSNATVTIDDDGNQLKTTAKSNLLPGVHTVMVHKSGYTSWKKQITVNSGGVLWLDYIQLFPLQNKVTESLKVDSSDNYAFSPNAKRFIAVSNTERGAISISDITGSTAKTKQASFVNILTPFDGEARLEIAKWSEDSSKVLIKHYFGGQFEWLLLDLERIEKSVNLTDYFQEIFDDVFFGAENGEIIFAAKSDVLNKLDVSNSVNVQIDSNVVRYVSYGDKLAYITITRDLEDKEITTLWTYRSRDTRPTRLREVHSSSKIAISSYRSDDYLAVFDKDALYVFQGQFQSDDNGLSGLSLLKTIAVSYDVADLSAKHRFFTLQSQNDFLSYDIETENIKMFNLGDGETKPIFWLNNYLFGTNTGQLVVYDFDGDNKQELLTAKAGTPAVITSDHKYFYFIDDEADGKLVLKQLNLITK
ncbi:MAG: PEGA domain-containing protein [Candidatus Nomurabacteria bacterium]|jgi:hypothetical protein|nr:PEGA domain-containing protein [Candidatus Nomurabacteria bacterium]